MLCVTSGSELFWNRRNWTTTNRNVMWIWIQLPFNENRMKISIKKSILDLQWNYLELYKHQLSSLKNKKPSPKLRIIQWTLTFGNWGNSLKKWFIVETYITYPLRMLKELSSHCRRFQRTNFLSQEAIMVDICQKLVSAFHILFNSTGL